MAKHNKFLSATGGASTPWSKTPEHDDVIMEMIDKHSTNAKKAFEEASDAIMKKYKYLRTPAACSYRYYSALTNPKDSDNQLTLVPVVLTKKGVITRGRRVTQSDQGLTAAQLAFLKKLVERLSKDQKMQLADMLVFES